MKTKQTEPRIQSVRKIGHLWQTLFGINPGGVYGYGVTRKIASINARLLWQKKQRAIKRAEARRQRVLAGQSELCAAYSAHLDKAIHAKAVQS